MTPEEALKELEPFTSTMPVEALKAIRETWPAAEPVLLAELDWRIEHPYAEDPSARFLYALFLCAEMKSEAAFERYLALSRLPTPMLDQIFGDMVTETLPHFFAATCHGRFDGLKALVEDSRCDEFVRAGALDMLMMLVREGNLPRDGMEAYCLDLLAEKLEREMNFVWDAAIGAAKELQIKQALPLIKTAYDKGWADPMCDSYGDVVAAISGDGDADAHYVHEYTLGSTEEEMGFYIGDWPADGQASPRDFSYLLEAPANDRKKRKRKPVNGNEPGRNDPCPCGSGKKYKKCCIDIGYVRDEDLPADLAEGPKNRTDEWIMAGAYYAGINAYGKALDCWEQAWPAVLDNLPDAVMDPDDEACTGLYNGFDFLSNWLQDVGSLIDDHVLGSIQAVQLGMEFYPAVLKRFPNMNEVIARNFEASLARLECACGKSEAAFARLQRMIEAYPQNAQGYAVLADLLSFDARTFGILPDIGQAQCLLTQALMIAKNAADWSLDLRLEDLRHWRD